MVLAVKCLICNASLTYTQHDPTPLINHVKQSHPSVPQSSKYSQGRKERFEKDLRQSLELNSEALKSVIDKEIQTDIAWKDLFKMSQAEETPRKRTKDEPRTSSSSRTSKTSEASMKVIPPKTVSAPARIDDTRRGNKQSPSNTRSTKKSRETLQMNIGKEAKVLYSRGDRRGSGDLTMPLTGSKDEKRLKRIQFYKTSIEKWKPVGDEKIHCPRCKAVKRPIVRTHKEKVTESSFMSAIFMTCWPCCFSPCLFPEPTHENLHCPVCNFHLGIYDHQLKTVISNPQIGNE